MAGRFLIVILTCVVLAGIAGAHPIAELARNGELDALRRAASDPRWEGTAAGSLAQALTSDASRAVPVYRRLADDREVEISLRTVAWTRLYGYAKVTGDRELESRAARWLGDHPSQAQLWFHGALPEPPSLQHWSVQIGAFSDESNARRLAAQQRELGYTVAVDPIRSGGRTLHAVRVGRFDDEGEAEDFARRAFGAAGQSYRVVERDGGGESVR